MIIEDRIMAEFGMPQEQDKALSEKVYCMEMNDTRYFLTEEQLRQELPKDSIDDMEFKYNGYKGCSSFEGQYSDKASDKFSVFVVEDKEQLKSLMTWENFKAEFDSDRAHPMDNEYPDFVPTELRSKMVLFGDIDCCHTSGVLPKSHQFNDTVMKYVRELGLTSYELQEKVDDMTLARREIAQLNYVSPVTEQEVAEICKAYDIDLSVYKTDKEEAIEEQDGYEDR